MHNTLTNLDYLQESGKPDYYKGIVWIYRPFPELEKLKQNGLEL